jgi:hypothetical protein
MFRRLKHKDFKIEILMKNKKTAKIIVPNAMELAHYKDLYEGAWWYHVPSGTLRYAREATGHHDLNFFGDIPIRGKGWVRGRVFKDEKGELYIMVYSEDFRQGRIPWLILKGIYDKLIPNLHEPVCGVVDDQGHDLIN